MSEQETKCPKCGAELKGIVRLTGTPLSSYCYACGTAKQVDTGMSIGGNSICGSGESLDVDETVNCLRRQLAEKSAELDISMEELHKEDELAEQFKARAEEAEAERDEWRALRETALSQLSDAMRQRDKARAAYIENHDALAALIVVVEGIREGEIKVVEFTTQPARMVLCSANPGQPLLDELSRLRQVVDVFGVWLFNNSSLVMRIKDVVHIWNSTRAAAEQAKEKKP